ncbi:ATP-binding cassette domain-containing protein [Microbacterium fluvii]|uniref:ATP-binding cassette domain-containing protein n=1 Tax=Microbacterium fluvii TaxID=415215 RepID=A0ABW2HIE6_9MICO|nr:ATP-binding cassette domain-containing protein [Microbacterium fluvii]MCU4673409.1 ATP-binding cassette domain-containing protein [Microbacterium fluvii]
MSLRPSALKPAAALAAGFIVVRVVYRVLFHGADGGGLVLLPMPVLRLPAPFAHVELLGPATLDGVWTAAVSAVPIAATILAFGVLNALVDVPRLIARGARRGPLRGVARMLSIAWATLPALADAVRSARFARRLRGERGGVRVLAPVLERTLERATAVAAALELRGYAGSAREGDCDHPVELRGVSAGFAASPTVAVDDVSLGTGRLVLLAGPTGSGKSTLLRALAGLHSQVDGGWLTGRMRVVGLDRQTVPPRDTSRTVGVVLQHPRDAFATERVRDEVGLALELRGVAPVIAEARVAEVAERVGIVELLDRPVRGLSAGQATLVAIAAAIVEQPILLLVDEPLADLDIAARARIVALLDALAHEAGMCVVVAEHRTAALAGIADEVLLISEGVVRADSVSELGADTTPPETGASGPIRTEWPSAASTRRSNGRAEGETAAASAAATARAVLEVRGLTVRHGDTVAVADAALAVNAGQIVALTGPNGAGKSSLLAAIALADSDDAVQVGGRRADWRDRAIALVPDASDDLFVRDTVAAECRHADRAARSAHRVAPRGTGSGRGARRGALAGGASVPDTAERFAALLGLDPHGAGFARRLAQHPRDLSVGERRCLAIALQTAHLPRVLLIDEPTRGLDAAARDLVAGSIVAQADAGTAVVLATHEAELAAALADRVLPIEGGVVEQAQHVSSRRFAPRSTPGEHKSGTSRAQRDETQPPGVERAQRDETSPRPDASRAQRDETSRPARPSWRTLALVAANLAAATAFLWPLVAIAVPAQAHAAVPYIALALAPVAVVLVLALLDGSVRSAHTLALLAVLAAIGAAIRIVGTGVGGVEALFVLLILAGRAYGPRFGLLVGAASILLSAVVWGGVGPWLPFQMFACGWIGAGAGLLPRRVRGWAEIGMLCAYGVVGSYAFGLIMNMWFWPFAVGADTSISYVPGGSVGENLANFLVYSLVTSTLTWDTLRAVTTVIGLIVVGRPVLAALRRAKPVAPASAVEPDHTVLATASHRP